MLEETDGQTENLGEVKLDGEDDDEDPCNNDKHNDVFVLFIPSIAPSTTAASCLPSNLLPITQSFALVS